MIDKMIEWVKDHWGLPLFIIVIVTTITFSSYTGPVFEDEDVWGIIDGPSVPDYLDMGYE